MMEKITVMLFMPKRQKKYNNLILRKIMLKSPQLLSWIQIKRIKKIMSK